MPGSGWCHHPQRKVSSDVKILVRRSELACRDDWSRSLWQPTTGDSVADVETIPPGRSGALLPVSPQSLRAVLNRNLPVAAAAGEDVLLSEGRIVSENEEPWQPPTRPFPAGHFDPRTAIFKAREAHREKLRATAMAARHVAEARTGAFAESRADSDLDDGRSATWDEADDPPEINRMQPGAVEATESPVIHSSEVRHTRSSHSVDPSLAEEGEGVSGAAFRDAAVPRAEEGAGSVVGLEPEVCAPDSLESAVGDAGVVTAPHALSAAAAPVWFRADLPRVCRACRDFRPGTDGQRGWCANAWAFTHRQLVREDDAAPCHSAIGDWWVPVDNIWLVAADVSAHGRPTPLLDRATGDERDERQRS